jgi:16S rRNA (cytosine1402-N4)-methyltransferase
MIDARHEPVMAKEVVAMLKPRDGGVYVDATFGAGGYSRAILDVARCNVMGFDRDPGAVRDGASLMRAYDGRLKLIERPFSEMLEGLAEHDIEAIDGAVFDLGVSSMQLDEAGRGFSFLRDGPLSMRMDDGRPNAADIVNAADENDLAAIFRVYGEEKRARRIARAIAAERAAAAITSTTQLAQIVARAAPASREDRIHPATRVFQALRIFVNDELAELAQGLIATERLLKPQGRLVVVTFHSLEDRIVKEFLAQRSGRAPQASRHTPAITGREATFSLLTRKPVVPADDEIARNPRARSAKMRAAERTAEAAGIADPASLLPPLNLSRDFVMRKLPS